MSIVEHSDRTGRNPEVPVDAADRPEFPERLRGEVLCYGSLTLRSRYLLSPLAGFTNLPFRRIVHQIGGVGLGTTDLVSARGLLEGSAKSLQLISTCDEDSPLAVQIFGQDPKVMHDAAQFLEERGVESVDINMGCPVDRITSGGSGSAMMCSPQQTVDLVKTVVDAVSIPVTVKMRLGWDDTQITAPRFAREFEQVGVAAVAIHGRTREQGFGGTVSLDGIRRVVEAVERIPVIGNGDIRSIADAARMMHVTGCQGISIGRGALANPWIFRQLVEWETTGAWSLPGNFDDRLELMLRQLGYLEELVGFERGLVMFRKMAHWYLKAMRVRAKLRHRVQTAATRSEFDAAIAAIRSAGPVGGSRTGVLPELHVPVPSGPVEKW
ncbi:tRNA dihydrouridine synthase DusB [Maioricimonas sp. JC845]|uniref:tRNA dihydrouridine synthase DusB n=1 Tax=Maioricimonas sp. JC845 TaxID=3232138 RepID=UPI003458804C